MGSALTKLGFGKGDVVTVIAPNCPEYAIVQLAVVGVGGVMSAVNHLYTSGDGKFCFMTHLAFHKTLVFLRNGKVVYT